MRPTRIKTCNKSNTAILHALMFVSTPCPFADCTSRLVSRLQGARLAQEPLNTLARELAGWLVCLWLFCPAEIFAAPVSEQQASNAVLFATAVNYPATAVSAQQFKSQFGTTTRSVARLDRLQHGGDTVGYVAKLNPSGYYLVSTDDQLPPWKLRADEGDFTNLPPGLVAVIKIEMAEDRQALKAVEKAGKSTDPKDHQQWQA